MKERSTTRSLDVLIVDPSPADIAAACASLRRRGHEVRVATRTDEALSGPDPGVLVASVELEDASGIELLAALRDRGAAPYALLGASMPSLSECRAAMRLGAADLLARPYDTDELVEAIERVLERAPAAAPNDSTEFRRSYPATRESCLRAVRDLAAFALRAGFGPVLRARAASAAAEAVENARVHAYEEHLGAIAVAARTDSVELEVTVRDTGVGFDSVSAQVESLALDAIPAPLPGGSVTRSTGGMSRMAAWSEDLRIDSSSHGTCVTLRFEAQPVQFEEEASADFSDIDWITPEVARRVLEAARGRETGDLTGMSPALAVSIGRLLAGRTASQAAQTALWS